MTETIERVLHVVNYGWPHIDGYTVRTSGIVTAQSQVLGITPTVATSPFPAFAAAADPSFSTPAWHDQQVRVGRTAAWERPGLRLAPLSQRTMASDLEALGRRTDAQLIHVHHPHYLAAAGRAAADRLGVPMIYELRCFNGDYDLDKDSPYFSKVRGPLFNRAEHRACRLADAVVTISDGLARRIRSESGSQSVHVVRNSVDTSRFRPPPETARGERPTDPSGRRIAHVGYATTFEPIESLDTLVDALVVARRDLETDVDLRATIVGAGSDFERIVAHRDRVADASWLDLPGFVPFSTMPDFLAGLDVFVVPRGDATVVQDTTPLKPLEALACGVPVVSTDIAALRELFAGHPTVRFATPNADALAQAIVDEIRADRRADPNDLDRSWAGEIGRYREIYAGLFAPEVTV